MISILFENDDLVAIDKPEGLASIPERVHTVDNLLTRLLAEFPNKLYVVHRLDKEVSGVILFAKHAAAHKCLNDQFSRRQIQKTYLALAHGVIRENQDTITAPIREFGSGRMGVDAPRGKPSRTDVQVIERLAAYTLLTAHPLTGRRHQLRVHLYSIGHPIVGDVRYGDKITQRQFPRLMLHAQRIEFRLPSGEMMTIEAPVPESFELVLGGIRAAGKQ